jgi:hypothetical protein
VCGGEREDSLEGRGGACEHTVKIGLCGAHLDGDAEPLQHLVRADAHDVQPNHLLLGALHAFGHKSLLVVGAASLSVQPSFCHKAEWCPNHQSSRSGNAFASTAHRANKNQIANWLPSSHNDVRCMKGKKKGGGRRNIGRENDLGTETQKSKQLCSQERALTSQISFMTVLLLRVVSAWYIWMNRLS